MNRLLLTFFFYVFFSQTRLHTGQLQIPFTLMIDPAGDAKQAGRKVDDNFERGVTLQYAQQLKSELEKRHPLIRVVLTRFPGETLQPLQNANFSNRLNVDFYLSIHFYHEKETRPSLFLYRFLQDHDPIPKINKLALYPYDKAHLLSYHETTKWADAMHVHLSNDCYATQFSFNGVYALPFKPLIGITAPALAIEIGLKEKYDWQHYVPIIADSLKTMITSAI